MPAEGTLRVGTVQQAESTVGYIAPDTGEESAAVLPNACVAFDSMIPPVGTRVVYRQTKLDESNEIAAADVLPEDHDFTGTIDKDNGNFGFILIDASEDRIFVLPIACAAFGGKIPPLKTMVKFKVVMDHKTGRPRADFVRPQNPQPGANSRTEKWPVKEESHESASSVPGRVYTGQVSRVKGNFGFIQPDDSSEDIFFMPRGCKGFYGMPPEGSRVRFEIVTDDKTGRPRADHIEAVEGGDNGSPTELLGSNVMGTISDPGGKFGFITQDDGNSMFVLPGSCTAFGMMIPPAGTRVCYDVVADPKTGRPRAENVQPVDSGGLVTALKGKGPAWQGKGRGSGGRQAIGHIPKVQSSVGDGARFGVIASIRNGFGFIEQDDGESMFVLPTSCKAFSARDAYAEVPPVGTPVEFDVVTDAKTGRPRAEHVRPAAQAGFFAGTVVKSGPQFGFINQDTQDGTEVAMFVLPLSCGGQIPPVGTRVNYQVVEDSKTGRPRAENVTTLGSLGSVQPAHPAPNPQWSEWGPEAPGKGGKGSRMDDMWMSGSICQVQPNFGFIQADDSNDRMFVLPGSCTGGALPPVGTRVTYRVVTDMKTGKPRAEDVTLEEADWAERAGQVIESGQRYGFILQDNGEKMFLLPFACAAFGSVIPPQGTRVTFRVVPDGKTGRPRAEDVCPEAGDLKGGKGQWAGSIRAKPRVAPY